MKDIAFRNLPGFASGGNRTTRTIPDEPACKKGIGDLIRCLRAFFKTEGLEDGDTINQYALAQPTNENTTLLEMQ